MNLSSKTSNRTKVKCVLAAGLNKWSTLAEFLFSLEEIGHIGQMPVITGFVSISSGTSFWCQSSVLVSAPLSIQYSTLESLSTASRQAGSHQMLSLLKWPSGFSVSRLWKTLNLIFSCRKQKQWN